MHRIHFVKADISQMKVDAIVNAANTSLLGGGGVDGAIHRASGPRLLEACKQLGGCKTGQAKITPGFNCPAKYIIHTPGPIWQGGTQNEAELLAQCYQNSLKFVTTHQLIDIAFPAISCGVYGYPIDEASAIAINTVTAFLNTNQSLQRVYFVCFNDLLLNTYQKQFRG